MNKNFSLLVVGNNAQDILEEYITSNDVIPYLRHRYDDKEKTQKNLIKTYENLLKNDGGLLKPTSLKEIKDILIDLKKQSALEFYKSFTYGMMIDDNGDAYSTENPNSKFDDFNQKGNFSEPFILNDLDENSQLQYSFSTLKGNVNWDLMHQQPKMVQLYERTWDLCHNIIIPENETDITIISNMNTVSNYFHRFKTKNEFVTYSTSFKCSAFCNKDIWEDIDSSKLTEFEWVSNFYNKFIKPLSDDTQINIYECTLYE